MQTGVRVSGLTAVLRALKELGLEVDDLKAAFSSIAEEGAAKVRQYAPRRSGRLAADARGNRAQSKAVITAGRASIPYAGPINYGWPARNIKPALFMQKADEDMQPIAVRRLEQEINHQIARRGLR